MAGFDVDRAQLRQVAVTLQQGGADMASHDLTPARSAFDQVLPTWEGADKDKFQTFVTTILTTGDTLASRLQSIGTVLLTSETTYDDAQQRQSGNIGNIGSVLGG